MFHIANICYKVPVGDEYWRGVVEGEGVRIEVTKELTISENNFHFKIYRCVTMV
jgi:hypothetical protein